MYDLRAEVQNEELLQALKLDYQTADIPQAEKVLLNFAEKLTLHPAKMCQADIKLLQAHGWSDLQILEAVQIISYFNYINRVADALGVQKDSILEDAFPEI